MEWPADADGDVMRRLESGGCDFSTPHAIDFQIDFERWPPSQQAVALLNERFGSVSLCEPENDCCGYAECTLVAPITYEFVTRTQREITVLMAPFDGKCDCWGVLH